jgi:hypothetical protein
MYHGKKSMSGGPGSAPSEAVMVLGEGRVGDLHHVSLQATDSKALEDWLRDNGYGGGTDRPDLKRWLDGYIARKWVLTAFKFAKPAAAAGESASPAGSSATELSTSAIRMSFDTNKPFYPYSEPTDQQSIRHHFGGSWGRRLRIYFIGTEKVTASKDDGSTWVGGPGWGSQLVWANRLPAGDREELLRLVGLAETTGPMNAYLTEFEDRQSPRPATADLFFRPNPDTVTVARDVIEQADPSNHPNPGRSFLIVAILGGGFLVALFAAAVLLWRNPPETAV